jgi:hypothetical protein
MKDRDDTEALNQDTQELMALAVGNAEALAAVLRYLVKLGIADPQDAIASLGSWASTVERRTDALTAYPLHYVVSRLDDKDPPALPPMKDRH